MQDSAVYLITKYIPSIEPIRNIRHYFYAIFLDSEARGSITYKVHHVSSRRHNRGMLYDCGTIPIQVFDIHVQVLEDEVGDVCRASTIIR